MNKVVLIGRMCADPELKFTQGTGTAICTFNLAVNRKFKKEGQPEADFIPIVIYGKIAEATATHMRKGRLISIAGRISTRSYDAKDGTKRYVTEIITDEVEFIDWGGNKKPKDEVNLEDVTPIDDSEIPF